MMDYNELVVDYPRATGPDHHQHHGFWPRLRQGRPDQSVLSGARRQPRLDRLRTGKLGRPDGQRRRHRFRQNVLNEEAFYGQAVADLQDQRRLASQAHRRAGRGSIIDDQSINTFCGSCATLAPQRHRPGQRQHHHHRCRGRQCHRPEHAADRRQCAGRLESGWRSNQTSTLVRQQLYSNRHRRRHAEHLQPVAPAGRWPGLRAAGRRRARWRSAANMSTITSTTSAPAPTAPAS